MSSKAKNISARLAAVQALYQASQNKQDAKSLIAEYLEHRNKMQVEDEETVPMDGALFKKIIEGVFERSNDLETLINDNFISKNKNIEPLLKSILLCASWELMANLDIDAPIIINDYLNVAHSFYESGEISLINGILDKISKGFRA